MKDPSLNKPSKRKKSGLWVTFWFCPECGRKKPMTMENCRHGN